jgi:hypothetical protein
VIQEKNCISPKTFDHLKDWVFNTDFVETLKASEQNRKRGHCYGVKEDLEATFPRLHDITTSACTHTRTPAGTNTSHTHTRRYKADGLEKGVATVSRRVYRRVLRDKVFVKLKKEHCMCNTCLRVGWRGIDEEVTQTIS